MTRLAGIEIGAPPIVVVPIFLLGLLLLSAIAARLARSATTRWLSGSRGDGTHAAPVPSLGIPISAAVLIGGLMLVVPEVTLPGRIGRWLAASLNIAFVLACALGLSRIAVAALTAYA